MIHKPTISSYGNYRTPYERPQTDTVPSTANMGTPSAPVMRSAGRQEYSPTVPTGGPGAANRMNEGSEMRQNIPVPDPQPMTAIPQIMAGQGMPIDPRQLQMLLMLLGRA